MATQSTPSLPVRGRKVSRAKVLKFVEQQFALADVDKDGALTPEELETFLHLLAHPARHHQGMP